MKQVNIGLFGFGVVGEGIYQVISQKPQLAVNIKKIVVKDPSKRRNAPATLFSTDPNTILKDEEIDLVVELIDDAEAAYQIVSRALNSGKSVVSANKKMIAERHEELILSSQKHRLSLLYEAAVCGSIPIIRNLEEYFDNDLLHSIQGIVNGSTNYILSQMLSENRSYESALSVAQEKGFAESNPSLDVEGIDAAYKLGIISLHAFGKRVTSNQIIRKGIHSLHPFDFQYAKEKNCVIKLIASCHLNKSGDLSALTVLPTFVSKGSALAQTNNEFNGILVESALADEQYFYGKGAGRYPTSSAVLSDISAYKYGYKYAFKKGIEAIEPYNQYSAKFYIAFDKKRSIDLTLFDSIDEQYVGSDRRYIKGNIALNNDALEEILTDPEISLLCYN